jgi:hypothetical protein
LSESLEVDMSACLDVCQVVRAPHSSTDRFYLFIVVSRNMMSKVEVAMMKPLQ